MAQRAQIKPVPPTSTAHMTPRFNLTNRLQRGARPINRGESYDRRNKIDQVMRNAANALRRGPLQLQFRSADKPELNRS